MTTEIAQDDPKFLPTQMGVTDHKLRKLRKEYDPSNLPNEVVKGNDAYVQVHNKVMEITRVRTNIEKVRKDLKADALEWGRKVDAEAKRLTAQVEDIEAPWKALKQSADEKQAREEEEARQAEQKRVEAIEAKVLQLKLAGEGLLNANSGAIKARLDKVRAVVVTEDDYEEFYDAAVHWHQQAMETLTTAPAAKVEQETLKAQMDAQQAELREAQRKLEEQQAVIARQHQEERDRVRSEGIAEAAKHQADAVAHTVKETQTEKVAPVSAVEFVELARPSEFESWWFEIGRNVKPDTHDEWAWESFRERLAQMAWEAASE